MIKRISILITVLFLQFTFAQKAQKVGYIDREYILENVPEYKAAQSKLDAKISNWNVTLNKLQSEIEALKLTLSNEKALLTKDIIAERNEDISIKEVELKEKKESYFGTSGDLFMLRKQLVKPVQDQIFNAIQEIVKAKKYDIIFDKSSDDMVMLYTNPKYDVSELVLQKIVKGRKKKANEKKKSDKEVARKKKQETIKTKAEVRKSKQEALKDRIEKQRKAKADKREAMKKAMAEKRAKNTADATARRDAVKKVNEEKKAKRIADTKAKREALKNKGKKTTPLIKEDKSNEVKEEVKEKIAEVKEKEVENTKKTKEEIREEKIEILKKRAENKKKKRDSLRKVATEKRAKKLAEIKERKKKLEESKNK